MKLRIYYDSGDGKGALLTAALGHGVLPVDRLPHETEIIRLLEVRYRGIQIGRVYRLSDSDPSVLWCGLGHSVPFVIRAWRHFLQFYHVDQQQIEFIECPHLKPRRSIGRSKRKLAKEARKKFASFQTVLLQRSFLLQRWESE